MIAGIGNLFLGDDGFGCELARRVAERPLPQAVRVVDFGIRSLDLTYALLEEYQAVILLDAAPRGHAPGTLSIIPPQIEAAPNILFDGHAMNPVKVLEAVSALGGGVDHVLLLACEPTPRDPDADWERALSDPVRSALAAAVEMVESIVARLINGGGPSGDEPCTNYPSP